eukprot:6183946-Pleurochrysis_carterae.AAC.3
MCAAWWLARVLSSSANLTDGTSVHDRAVPTPCLSCRPDFSVWPSAARVGPPSTQRPRQASTWRFVRRRRRPCPRPRTQERPPARRAAASARAARRGLAPRARRPERCPRLSAGAAAVRID